MVNLRPRVFVTRQFFPEALEVLTDAADTEVWPDDEPPTPEQLLGKVVEADGILTNIMDRIDADVFQAAHRLKPRPEAAPVRICPILPASMHARSAPDS